MLYTADFETTTDESDCRVWAYGICQIGNTENFIYGNSLDDFMEWIQGAENPSLYFHNLKFDAESIFIWLYEHGFIHVKTRKELVSKTFTTLISDKGQFYSVDIVFERKGHKVCHCQLIDSMKIFPNMSVDRISKAFGLPLQKLELVYSEFRPVGHELTPHEIEYVKHDVTIMAIALKLMFDQELTYMTLGRNALESYKGIVTPKNFERWFPPPTYDADIRQAYKGGWTYLKPQWANKDIGAGIVLDKNSMYPWVMRELPLPYGEGKYFEGEYKPDKMYNLYIVQLTCQFKLKPEHLPSLVLENRRFGPNEYAIDSGPNDITMTLTSVDLEMFIKHYDVYNVEYHGGWKFKSSDKLFRDYVDKWYGVKEEATKAGNKALREIAKLMLNNLYGKFAVSPKCRSKYPVYDNGRIRYITGDWETRDNLYIPAAAFITAWARHAEVSAAQLNYDRFVYGDTDSLKLIGTEPPIGLELDKYKLGAWKEENKFTNARFIRAKTYIEEIDGEIHVTCAGMPKRCHTGVTWENFRPGQSFAGKLKPKHVKGGIVLVDEDFTIQGIDE